MKFRRKPIDRSVIDAVKLDDEYVWRDADDVVQRMPHKEFEELYQPAHARRKPKKAGGRKRKGNGVQPGAAAQ